MALKMENLSDAEHQAIWNAETLARAELIKADSKLFAEAVAMAKRLVDDEQAEAEAMKTVSEL